MHENPSPLVGDVGQASRLEAIRSAAFDRRSWMVPVAAMAMVGTLPGRTHGLGLITSQLMDEFHLSALAMGKLNFWATLIGATACAPFGWMIDRHGPRRSLTFALFALAVVVLTTSQIESATALFFAVTASRGFGQSMLSLASLAVLGNWFEGRALGPATGIFSVLMSVGFSMAFPLVGRLVKQTGWRSAWFDVGLALLGLAIAAWMITRDPETAGKGDAKHSPDDSFGATIVQALMTPAFWAFALASSGFLLISSGVSLFNQAIFAERGFSADDYYSVTSLSFLVGMTANLAGGLLAERISLRWQMSAALTLISAAMIFFPRVETRGELYAYATVMAASGGLVTIVFFAVWARWFGKRELGKIQGAAQMMTVIASAFGPVVLGYSHDQYGSYLAIFPMLSLATVALAIATALVPAPRWLFRVDAQPARPSAA